ASARWWARPASSTTAGSRPLPCRGIEQSDVEVFHLHASRVNFGESILDAPNRLLALRLAPRQMDDIQQHAAAKKNPVRRLLQLGVHVFNQLLAVDRLPEQRLQNRQKHLRFIEGEGAVGHVSLFYCTSSPAGRSNPHALAYFVSERFCRSSATWSRRFGILRIILDSEPSGDQACGCDQLRAGQW